MLWNRCCTNNGNQMIRTQQTLPSSQFTASLCLKEKGRHNVHNFKHNTPDSHHLGKINNFIPFSFCLSLSFMIGFTFIYVYIKTHSQNYNFVLHLSSTLVKIIFQMQTIQSQVLTWLRCTCMWKRHNHVPIESSHDYSFRFINCKPKEQSGDFIYIFMQTLHGSCSKYTDNVKIVHMLVHCGQ